MSRDDDDDEAREVDALLEEGHLTPKLELHMQATVQGGWGGWSTGNGKKLSSSQAQLGQAASLAVA